ncbi:MAG: hypothetical protein IJF54_01250 [Clostridia bacterium]|nr:hypothetical protein [Clostridia bacterium]
MQYYNSNNAAYDLDLFAPKSNVVPQTAPGRKAVIKQLPVTHQKAKTNNLSVFAKIAAVAIVLFMVCFTIYTRVEISDTKAAIAKADREIEVLDSETVRLEMELENKISYKNLEQAAAQLGMHKKSKSQVHYIDSNENDSAQILNADADK